jgi:hypothetical protein
MGAAHQSVTTPSALRDRRYVVNLGQGVSVNRE